VHPIDATIISLSQNETLYVPELNPNEKKVKVPVFYEFKPKQKASTLSQIICLPQTVPLKLQHR
jgi:hypothetical protein